MSRAVIRSLLVFFYDHRCKAVIDAVGARNNINLPTNTNQQTRFSCILWWCKVSQHRTKMPRHPSPFTLEIELKHKDASSFSSCLETNKQAAAPRGQPPPSPARQQKPHVKFKKHPSHNTTKPKPTSRAGSIVQTAQNSSLEAASTPPKISWTMALTLMPVPR